MRLRQLAKDKDSGTGGCPSVHIDEDSRRLVFQGQAVGLEYLPPNPLPGEQAVVLDPAIVRDALRELGWLS